MTTSRRIFEIVAVCVGLLVLTAPSFAHHSFAAEYQVGKEFKLTGVLTKVEWINPHIQFYVDAKDQNGNVVTWTFSGLPPNMLASTRSDPVYVQSRRNDYCYRGPLQR